MTEAEKSAMLSSMTGETAQTVLSTYLKLAASKILERAYPFKKEVVPVPVKYHPLQVEIACYLYNKRGAEGETLHSENGISRQYETASVPYSLIRSVTPMAEVLK